MRRTLSGFLVVTATMPMLNGCVSREPIRAAGLESSTPGPIAVLWSRSIYVKNLFERPNRATVTRVDGVTLSKDKTLSGPPIELLPGQHVVEIRFDKAVPIPNYFGDMPYLMQSERSITASFKADHSYMPFTRKYCDKDWFWIVDTGRSPQDDMNSWKQSDTYLFSYQIRSTNSEQLQVVGGEAPPASCDEQHK
jgi:hypothetical protein